MKASREVRRRGVGVRREVRVRRRKMGLVGVVEEEEEAAMEVQAAEPT